MFILLFVFIVVPVVELAILISVGSVIGVIPTLLLVLATAIVGTYLLRQQGFSLLATAQSQAANGQLPGRAMLEGLLLVFGGALLLTPGFMTDGVGFLCLFPASRAVLVTLLLKYVVPRLQVHAVGGVGSGTHRGNGYEGKASGNTFEGEHWREP